MYTAANDKQVTVLIGLDLSAAFDTVNHGILLERLQSEFGVKGTPLATTTSLATLNAKCSSRTSRAGLSSSIWVGISHQS